MGKRCLSPLKDEMNLFASRSYKTAVELEELALVPTQMISPKASFPIVGIIQDSLLGAWLLTKDDILVNKFDMMNILMHYDDFQGRLPPPVKADKGVEYWSGKQLMSSIIPDINFKKGGVTISRGQLVSGRFNKKTISTGESGNLIHVAWKDHGIWMARNLINNIQRITNNWLLINGSTMGIGDIIPRKPETEKQIRETLLEGYLKVHQKQKDIDDGVSVVSIGKTQEEQFENDANEIMNASQGDAGMIAEKDMDVNKNNLYQMAKGAGSKGAAPNIMQMMACVGQQTVMNERVPKKYGDRTLPHFQKFDDSPDARGFCKDSFMQGLNPSEFFFHAMSGRVGSIDTAIKSVTGDTPIVIIDKHGDVHRVQIGEWIDKLLTEHADRVKRYEEREMELLDIGGLGISIPTVDADGHVSWGAIKNITRHDPGQELYKIKTLGGREVIVTESKSLLIWNKISRKFERMDTPLVKVGDFVPVTKHLPQPTAVSKSSVVTYSEEEIVEYINMYGILSISGSTVYKLHYKDREDSEFVSMLLTRLDIYSMILDSDLIISGTNALLFKEKVLQRKQTTWRGTGVNDVVLDPIISIQTVDVSKYPKVYDLTIPSTLNFGLANGLHVVDTADSGYIARQLMKGNEDILVTQDLSVRNSMGNVIEWRYGDNGMSLTEIERLPLKFFGESKKSIKAKYEWADELKATVGPRVYKQEIADKKLGPMVEQLCKNELTKLTMFYNLLHHRFYKYKAAFSDIIVYSPVDIERTITNYKMQFTSGGEDVEKDLGPRYIINEVDILCAELPLMFSFHRHSEFVAAERERRGTKVEKFDPEEYTESLDGFNAKQNAVILFEIYLRSILSSKRLLTEFKISKFIFDKVLDRIRVAFNMAIAPAGDMVGPIASQSIAEPITQMTLNSFDYKDEILVERDGEPLSIKMGEFVDRLMEENPGSIEVQPDGTEYLPLHESVKFNHYTVNEYGDCMWRRIEAVTRHLPKNKDGSDTLLKVKTWSGRKVHATKAKSFLVFENDEIVGKTGEDLVVGDRVPVVAHFFVPKEKILHKLDMETFFPKTEYIWGSEMNKARVIRDESRKSSQRPRWFQQKGSSFTVPHSRSDILGVALDNTLRIRKDRKSKTKQEYKVGCIYPKKCIKVVSQIPEKLPLDNLTGFFFGAYLAEGLATETYVCISNNDAAYRQKIYDFCDRMSIKYHTVVQKDKIKVGWTSTDIRIHSVLLARFMKTTCRTRSQNKIVPDWVLFANENFLKGLIDGYISGDGCVSVDNTIEAGSVSKKMLVGIQNILTRFSIFSKLIKPKRVTKNNRGTKAENILQHYIISIRNVNCKAFAKTFTLTLQKKQDRLNAIKDHVFNNTPFSSSENYFMDVFLDKVVSIEEYKPTKKYAYDLTVADTRNLSLYSGIACKDTFHWAGISAKSNVTRGVPRMKELLSVSKNMKLPFLIIKLKEEDQSLQYRAKEIAHNIEFTTLNQFVRSHEVFYEPDPKVPVLPEDRPLVAEFMKNTVGFKLPNNVSKFVIRLVLNRNQMIYKQMRMDLLQFKINSFEGGSMFAIVSDDNAEKLVIRVHLDLDKTGGKSKKSELELIDKYKRILLSGFQLRGISDVTSANIRLKKTAKFNQETGETTDFDEWYIDTDGTNLRDTINDPNIDFTQTISNDVTEVLEVLGIEAARATLYREFNDTFEFSGSSLNYHHIALLVDLMTHSGRLMSINRFGINRVEDGPLSRASFEETIDQLRDAAQFNERDNMKGSSANIMFGQVGRFGTGYTDIIFDTGAFGVEADDVMSVLESVSKG